MSTLVETIDRLEATVLSLIDEIEELRHVEGSAQIKLKEELFRTREELTRNIIELEKFYESKRSWDF